KLPKATIILGCLVDDMDEAALELLREGAKADLIATSIGKAVKLCIEATGTTEPGQEATGEDKSTTAAA
ncbi:AI-2E family transporter, partial [Herbaspirillum sp. HC18]